MAAATYKFGSPENGLGKLDSSHDGIAPPDLVHLSLSILAMLSSALRFSQLLSIPLIFLHFREEPLGRQKVGFLGFLLHLFPFRLACPLGIYLLHSLSLRFFPFRVTEPLGIRLPESFFPLQHSNIFAIVFNSLPVIYFLLMFRYQVVSYSFGIASAERTSPPTLAKFSLVVFTIDCEVWPIRSSRRRKGRRFFRAGSLKRNV